MAGFGKEFILDKDENFDEFVASLGISEDKAELVRKHKSAQKLVKLGDDEYVFVIVSHRGTKELKFTNGVEFDEEVAEGIVAKSTFTVDGNVVIQQQKFEDGRSLTFKREFSEDSLVVTITSSFWDGSAKRYYVPVQN
ncbi:unnamed protein product, partial [Brenthis ino]